MTTPPIIGLSGHKRNGKDAVADILIKELGRHPDGPPVAFKHAFADSLKIGLQTMLGWDDRHTDGELKEVVDPVYGFSPRKAMQTLGTDWGRRLNPDVWVTAFGLWRAKHEERAAEVFDIPPAIWVVTDVRFPNEFDKVKELGGVVWRVVRPGFEAPVGSHESETALDRFTFDRVIVNDGTLEGLADKVRTALQEP